MKFIAKKNNKEKIIFVDGYYLVEKDKLPNATQTQMAWKKRKDELRKAGWSIKVIDVSIRNKQLKSTNNSNKREKIVRLFGYKTIVKEE